MFVTWKSGVIFTRKEDGWKQIEEKNGRSLKYIRAFILRWVSTKTIRSRTLGFRRKTQDTREEARTQAKNSHFRTRTQNSGEEDRTQKKKPEFRRRSQNSGEEVRTQAKKPEFSRRSHDSGE